MHKHTIYTTHTWPLEWTGGRRKLESGPACLVLFSSFVGACFKGERGMGNICSFSILYRISLFPFPFAVVSVFFLPFSFFFKKFVSDLCFCFLVRCVTTICPHFLRLASRFAHCSRKETSCPLVVPYAYRIDPYYITLRISTPQRDLFIQAVTVRYLYSGIRIQRCTGRHHIVQSSLIV